MKGLTKLILLGFLLVSSMLSVSVSLYDLFSHNNPEWFVILISLIVSIGYVYKYVKTSIFYKKSGFEFAYLGKGLVFSKIYWLLNISMVLFIFAATLVGLVYRNYFLYEVMIYINVPVSLWIYANEIIVGDQFILYQGKIYEKASYEKLLKTAEISYLGKKYKNYTYH